MVELKTVKVFIASPGDLAEERKLFPEVIHQVNKIKGNIMGFNFKAVGWEDALPGFGRPQAIINKDVEECHIFVMLLWTRWGRRSGKKFSSGTLEEYTLAFERYKKTKSPHLLLYFRSVPPQMMADPGPELLKVIDFRTRIETERICLFKSYETLEQWEKLLEQHLCLWLDQQLYGKEFGKHSQETNVMIPPEVTQKITDLEKQLQLQSAQLETAQEKLKREAAVYASNAFKLVDEGKFTLAEEMFARSLGLYEIPEVLSSFGDFFEQIGLLDRAKVHFERLLQISLDSSDQKLQSVAYTKLGNVYRIRGEMSNAEKFFNQALQIDTQLGHKARLAIDYNNLGIIYGTRNDFTKAEEMFKLSLDINKELNDKEGVASNYGNLGSVYLGRDDLPRAVEMYSQALEINKQLGRKEGLASNYGNLVTVYGTLGDVAKTEEVFALALEINKTMGRKEGMADNYGNFGVMYQIIGNLAKAEEMHNQALDINKKMGRKAGMADNYGNLGTISKLRGELPKAKEFWMKAIDLYADVENASKAQQLQSRIDELNK